MQACTAAAKSLLLATLLAAAGRFAGAEQNFGGGNHHLPERRHEVLTHVDIMVHTPETTVRIQGLAIEQPVLCKFLASLGPTAVGQSRTLCAVGNRATLHQDDGATTFAAINSTNQSHSPYWHSPDPVEGQNSARTGGSYISATSVSQSSYIRRLQDASTNCSQTGNNSDASLDAVCAAAGMVPIENAASTASPHGGANTTGDRSGCCTCPAGTTAAYADEHIGFRFRSEGITTSSDDGSLRWNATVPSGLAFTMTRPPDPMAADQGVYAGSNFTEPSRVVPPGVPAGVYFDQSAGGSYDQIMYSNLKLAIGAENTIFVVVTPMPFELYGTLVAFRPGGGLGSFGIVLGAPAYGKYTMISDDWGYSGFQGPQTHPGAPGPRTRAVAIFRTRKKHNTLGVVGPVTDFALVDVAGNSTNLSWTSELRGTGLDRYNRAGVSNEDYDLDMRNTAVDIGHALGAGFMHLGNWGLPYGRDLGFSGVIHAVELHSVGLSDRHVEDVVANLRSWMDPSYPAPPKCEPCLEGTFDRDGDVASMCEPCDAGRFSEIMGASNTCAGTCESGSTITAGGATSARACTSCPAGSFGAASAAATDITTMICSPCEPGRFSAIAGATSNESCALCPASRFSGSGWQTCERSGCMDRWADSYAPDATVDDGSCFYNCSNLWNRTRGGAAAGGCIIFEDGGWQRLAPNGTHIGSGVFDVFLEGHWIVQGRAVAGATVDAPDYEQYDTDFATITFSTSTVGLYLRCVSIVNPNPPGVGVISTGISISLDRLIFENVVILDSGTADAYSLITIAVKHADVSYLTCKNNQAEGRGGCLFLICPSRVSHSEFENNQANGLSAGYGGAIALRSSDSEEDAIAYPANMTLEYSRFVKNRASTGGAIHVGTDAFATVRSCLFEGNVAATFGGAIGVQMGTITIMLSFFVANQGSSLGAALYIDQPHAVKLLDVEFDPFVDGALVVFISGRLSGCAQHPCDAGHSCSYERYSLHCTPCPLQQFSADGLQCATCPAGEEPMQNQSGCVGCSDNTFSAFGVCDMCAGRASQDHTACLDCPLNMVADPPELGCRCEKGYYDASVAGPLLCYDRALPFNQMYLPATEDDRKGWARQALLAQPIESENDFCQECPAQCLDCLYPGYAGRPQLKPGYAAATGPGWFEQGTRVVFECPVTKLACLGENVSQVTSNGTAAACEHGYTGVLCTTCSQTHSMKSSKCAACKDWTRPQIVLAVLLLAALVAAFVYIRRKIRINSGSKMNILLAELIPDLVADFKVFIGLYQVICSMNFTMEITYPEVFEYWIGAVRSLANFDVFTLPGLSCVMGSSVVGKFWFSALLPPGIVLLFGLNFLLQVRQSRIEHELDENWDAAVWEEIKKEVGDDHTHDYSHEDQSWIKKTGPGQAAAEGEGQEAGEPEVNGTRAAMKKHAVRIAHARQVAIGWAFMVIFLIYPSLCTNIFAIFHCFTVGVDESGASIAYIVADFRYQCTGVLEYTSDGGSSFYSAHFWLGVLFVLMYPLGIPLWCGTTIFRQRAAIKDGSGPSALKRLYEDYKPDHCLWEIYQLLQKVALCGLLGFFARGTLIQASAGLVVTEFVLLAFMRTMPYNDSRTNLLAITAQLILVFTYFATILLKADMAGELVTDDGIGLLMVCVNLPMAVFFVWDVRLDIKEHFAAVNDLVDQHLVVINEDAGTMKIANPMSAAEDTE